MTGTFLLTVVDTLSILFMGDVMQHRQQIHSALIPGADCSHRPTTTHPISPMFSTL